MYIAIALTLQQTTNPELEVQGQAYVGRPLGGSALGIIVRWTRSTVYMLYVSRFGGGMATTKWRSAAT